jgi:hypothetical protein
VFVIGLDETGNTPTAPPPPSGDSVDDGAPGDGLDGLDRLGDVVVDEFDEELQAPSRAAPATVAAMANRLDETRVRTAAVEQWISWSVMFGVLSRCRSGWPVGS